MANHIKRLQVETYRGVRELNIENLGSINVLVGDNNTGKTSVLEAIQLLCSANEYDLIQIARQREKYRASIRMGLSILDSILFMFDVKSNRKSNNNYYICVGGTIHDETGKTVVEGETVEQIIDLNEIAKYNPIAKNRLAHSVVEGQEEALAFFGKIKNTFNLDKQLRLLDNNDNTFEINNYTRVMRSPFSENRILEVTAIQTIDHIIGNAFSKLIKNKDIKERAVKLLKEFDETITDIRYINDDSRFVPVIESAIGDYIPLSLYGDGMKKALTMLNAIVNTENGVVLIDEFETSLHTTAMSKVFNFILEVSQQLNIQLFLTTHSIEAVDKLLESAGQHIEDLRVIRLKKKDGITIAKVTNGEDALNDRIEYNMELRI